MGKKILYALLLVLTAYLGFWFYQNYSWVEEQKEVGFQGLAKRKPLLAAEFFLQKIGVRNKLVNGLVAFRDTTNMHRVSSILIATKRETLNTELVDNLLQWLIAGGNLIVEARYCKDTNGESRENYQAEKTAADPDFVFRLWGLCVKTLDDKTIKAQGGEASPVTAVLADSEQQTSIQVYFPYWEVLKQLKTVKNYDLTWKIEDPSGPYLMQYAVGKGRITVLSTTDIFTNDYIDQYDHARLLLELVQPSDRENNNLQSSDMQKSVWLVAVDNMPSLWRWLWQNAGYVMVSLSLLFLLWLWRAPLRFGPVLDDKPVARRELLEHIEASAYYRWHYKQLPRLVASVQEELWEQIQLIHPVIRRENPKQAWALLEDIARIQQAEIKKALMPLEKISEKDFEQTIKNLNTLKNNL